MPDRFWDKENKFINGFLKEYNNWVLEVNYRQHTLGCYIILCKRNIEKITDLAVEELVELTSVMKEMETALLTNDQFKPDRFNYMQLGNAMHNLHFHGVPRYKSQRVFDNKIWIDSSYGNVFTFAKEGATNDLVKKINQAIKPYLP